jgi:hypothetical protein
MAVTPLLQAVVTNWNLRAIDILITILLTVLIGLSTWALKTVLTHAAKFEKVNESLSKVTQQIWGVDGNNGHASEIREIKRSFRRIERFMLRLDMRVHHIEEARGHPSGEHERFESGDDAEDD